MKTKVSKKYLDRNGKWVLTTKDVIELPDDDENFILLMDEVIGIYNSAWKQHCRWDKQRGYLIL